MKRGQMQVGQHPARGRCQGFEGTCGGFVLGFLWGCTAADAGSLLPSHPPAWIHRTVLSGRSATQSSMSLHSSSSSPGSWMRIFLNEACRCSERAGRHMR